MKLADSPSAPHIWDAGTIWTCNPPTSPGPLPGSRPAALAINAKDDDECCI
jgi:hypothetical protein